MKSLISLAKIRIGKGAKQANGISGYVIDIMPEQRITFDEISNEPSSHCDNRENILYVRVSSPISWIAYRGTRLTERVERLSARENGRFSSSFRVVRKFYHLGWVVRCVNKLEIKHPRRFRSVFCVYREAVRKSSGSSARYIITRHAHSFPRACFQKQVHTV